MRVVAIFNSIDGEVTNTIQGRFSTFIRLAGCNLRCKWCDTVRAQAMDSGEEMSLEQVLAQVKEIGCDNVTITGGEPQCQKRALKELLHALRMNLYDVSVETNGSMWDDFLYDANSIIMDYKLPSSGMEDEMMLASGFSQLSGNDFVKFVVSDMVDYERAKVAMEEMKTAGCSAWFAFSPCFGTELSAANLVELLQKDKLFDTVVNIQLHKYIWPKAGETEV